MLQKKYFQDYKVFEKIFSGTLDFPKNNQNIIFKRFSFQNFYFHGYYFPYYYFFFRTNNYRSGILFSRKLFFIILFSEILGCPSCFALLVWHWNRNGVTESTEVVHIFLPSKTLLIRSTIKLMYKYLVGIVFP